MSWYMVTFWKFSELTLSVMVRMTRSQNSSSWERAAGDSSGTADTWRTGWDGSVKVSGVVEVVLLLRRRAPPSPSLTRGRNFLLAAWPDLNIHMNWRVVLMAK